MTGGLRGEGVGDEQGARDEVVTQVSVSTGVGVVFIVGRRLYKLDVVGRPGVVALDINEALADAEVVKEADARAVGANERASES